MSKNFTQAPKPKPLTPEAIAAFERGGVGQDTLRSPANQQTHIPSNVQNMESVNTDSKETTNNATPEKNEPFKH